MFIHLDAAADLLNNNQVVAIPTETVYGLAAKATSHDAVSKIYALKNRPSFNPLIVHVHDLDAIATFAHLSAKASACCAFFWDQKSPLTVVLPLKEGHLISPLVTAGLQTIAVRLPHHPICQDLLARTGPLAAPSANVSNTLSPTSADLVMQSFKEKCPPILDGGACTVGVESTILDLSTHTPHILRPGGVTKEMLDDYFKDDIHFAPTNTIKAPGQMKVHYSPGCPVLLNKENCQEGEVLLAFGPNAPEDALNLSPAGDLVEAAAHLFQYLAILALQKPKAIAVMPIPLHGMGAAINDRLSRAAAL
ncbi:MAG: Threonylcarbamoyl-AMP synthase [Holosporales bacterium]